MNLSAIFLRSLKPERCDFLGKNRPAAGSVQKLLSTLVLLLRGTVNSDLEIFKIAQNTTSEGKERQYTAGKVTTLISQWSIHIFIRFIATEEANGESSTFTIKLQMVLQSVCGCPMVLTTTQAYKCEPFILYSY